MALSTEQHAAYQVFGELGWAQARLADVESLPLGTPQQQATARRGLTKGPWGITADDRNPWTGPSALTRSHGSAASP